MELRRPVGTLFLGSLWEAVPSNPATETGLTSLRAKVVAAESRTSMGMGPSMPQPLLPALMPSLQFLKCLGLVPAAPRTQAQCSMAATVTVEVRKSD